MKRRKFLQGLMVAPVIAKTIDVGAGESLPPILRTTGTTTEKWGYNPYEDYTWLRTTRTLSSGKEWHDICRCDGVNYKMKGGEKYMRNMRKTSELVWQRALRRGEIS
jgi:hypothetical protein